MNEDTFRDKYPVEDSFRAELVRNELQPTTPEMSAEDIESRRIHARAAEIMRQQMKRGISVDEQIELLERAMDQARLERDDGGV